MLTPNNKNKILRWYRFTTHMYNTNQTLLKDQWDAIAFIPKVDISFMGFSFFEQNTRNNFSLRFKIMIGDVELCEKEVRLNKTSFPDPEDSNIMLVDIQKEGFKYAEVRKNEKIHIMIKTWEDNYTDGYYCYGTCDSNSDPVNAKNEDDFEVEESQYSVCRRATKTMGMIPSILYAK